MFARSRGTSWTLGLALLTSPAFADPPGDPSLPVGAAARFGVGRPVLTGGPAVALRPPAYTEFLAPTLTGGVRRYDLTSGRPLDPAGDPVGPGQVVVSADGKRAAIARAGAVTVAEVDKGSRPVTVRRPDGVTVAGTPGIALSADGRVVAFGARTRTDQGAVVVVDVDTNDVRAVVETGQASPAHPALSADGKLLATLGPPPPSPNARPKAAASEPVEGTRTAQVWETASGKELFKARVTGMGGDAVAAAFSPDGSLLAVSAGDGPVDLFDVKAGKRVRTLLGHKGQGVRVAFSPAGATIAAVAADQRVERWSVDGRPLGIGDLPPHMSLSAIAGLAFVDNERTVAWMTSHEFVLAWEGTTGKPLAEIGPHAAPIRGIAFPAGGRELYSAGADGSLYSWDLSTGRLGQALPLHPSRAPGQPLVRPSVLLSADGTRAFWITAPTLSEVFDLETGASLYCIPAPSTPPAPVRFLNSHDGTKVVVAANPTDPRRSAWCTVWDVATRRLVGEFEFPTAAVASAVLSLDSTRLVVAATGREAAGRRCMNLVSFDLASGKKLGDVVTDATGAVSLAVADGSKVLISSSTGRIWTVHTVTGDTAEIDRVPARGEPALSGWVMFSPDGKRFAVGVVGEPYRSYGVRVYDWEKKKPLATFVGHVGPVSFLRFSPDGKRVASGSHDGSVILWDLDKGPSGR
jgi:WD40 repeat protein